MASESSVGHGSVGGGAYYYSSSSPVVVYLVLILVFNLFPSSSSTANEVGAMIGTRSVKVSKVYINQMCSKAENPKFCIEVLVNADSYYSEGVLDLESLEIIVLRLATVNAADTHDYIINSLSDDQKNNDGTNTTDNNLQKKNRSRLTFCEHRYRSSMRDLQAAAEFLVYYDYNGIIMMASSVRTYAKDCEHVFKSQPAVRSPFTQRNKNLADLADIVVILSITMMSS